MACVEQACDYYSDTDKHGERYRELLWKWSEYARDYDGQATLLEEEE